MPGANSATTSGESVIGTAASPLEVLGATIAAGAYTSTNLRMIGLPHLRLDIDATALANPVTGTIQVRVSRAVWHPVATVVVAAGTFGTAVAEHVAAREARFVLAGTDADAPVVLLSATAT